MRIVEDMEVSSFFILVLIFSPGAVLSSGETKVLRGEWQRAG